MMLAEGKRLFFSRRFLLLVILCMVLVQLDVIKTYKEEGADYQQGYHSELAVVQNMPIEEGLDYAEKWQVKWQTVYGLIVHTKESSSLEDQVIIDSYKENDPETVEEFLNGEFEGITAEEAQARKIACRTLAEQLSALETQIGFYDLLLEQAEIIQSTSLFSKRAFNVNNVVKTVKDFEKVQDILPQIGDDRALESAITGVLTPIMMLSSMLIFCFFLLDDERCQVKSLFYTMKGGRRRLAVSRLKWLFLASIIVSLLIPFARLCTTMTLYDGWHQLGRPLRSFPTFSNSCTTLTLGGYMGVSLLLSVVSCFILGLLLLAVFNVIQPYPLALLAIGTVMGVEYLANARILENSIWAWAKYINIILLVKPYQAISAYLNLSFFSIPIGIQMAIALFFMVLSIGCVVVYLWLQIKKKPVHQAGVVERLVDALKRKMHHKVKVRGMLWYEAEKLLRIQKGWVIVAAAILFAFYSDKAPRFYMSAEDYYASLAYSKYAGEVTEASLSSLRTELEEIEVQLEADVQSINEYEELANRTRGFQIVEEKMVDLLEDGAELPLVNPYGLERWFGQESISFHRLRSFMTILFIALLCGGIGSFEIQSDTGYLLGSLPRGTKKLCRTKLSLSFLCGLGLWGSIYIPELRELHRTVFGLGELLSAPAACLDMFQEVPKFVTIRSLIVFVYAIRLIMTLGAAAWCVFLSMRLAKTTASGISISTLILVVPGIFGLSMEVLYDYSFTGIMAAVSWARDGVWIIGGIALALSVIPMLILLRKKSMFQKV